MAINPILRLLHNLFGNCRFGLECDGILRAFAGDDGCYFNVWHGIVYLENV